MQQEKLLTRIKRDFYIYAAIIVIGMFINIFGGNITNMEGLIQGTVRVLAILFIASTLNNYTKTTWWVAVIFSGFFSIIGLLATFFILSGSEGLTSDYMIIITLIALFLSSIFLFDAFITLLKPEAKRAFVK